MVKTLCFQFRGHRFSPWLENKVTHVVQCGQIYVCMYACKYIHRYVCVYIYNVKKNMSGGHKSTALED